MSDVMKLRKYAYVRTWTFAAIGALALIGAFNMLVDPYRYFAAPRIAGLNALKPRPDANLASVKLMAASQLQPQAVVLGNSRMDVAIDPLHPAWHGRQAYNLGIPGGGICSAWSSLQVLRSGQGPELIVLGADFLDFLTRSQSLDCSAGAQPQPLQERLRAIGSLSGLQASLDTVLMQSDPYPDELTEQGLSPVRNYERIAATDGYEAMFRQRAQETALSIMRAPHQLTLPGRTTSLELETLRKIIADAIAHGSRLEIVIYPYHAQYLVMFDDAGLWPLFETWKRMLLAMVEQEAAGARTAQVRIWDFSGLTSYHAEPIPAPSARDARMQWYWEGGHFKQSLGNLMLQRMFAADADDGTCDAFGAVLTSANLESCLQSERNRLDGYKAEHTQLVAEVSRIVAAAVAALPST
jgi:hypothetical protein